MKKYFSHSFFLYYKIYLVGCKRHWIGGATACSSVDARLFVYPTATEFNAQSKSNPDTSLCKQHESVVLSHFTLSVSRGDDVFTVRETIDAAYIERV